MFKSKEQNKKNIQNRQYRAAENDINRIFQAEEELRQAIRLVNKKALELNFLNANSNRGVVNLEDYMYHHLISQKSLNEDYKSSLEKSKKSFEQENEVELEN